MNYRIGLGYDIHPLVRGRKLILGGVNIPYAKGLKGHSDADVLIHAICDALLGAMGKDDIGKHFPDTDKSLKDISSIKLLGKVSAILRKEGYKINNLDTVMVLEAPRVSPFKDKMKREIAAALDIASSNINIKATTQEGIGQIGRGKAAAAYAVALIRRAGV